MQSAGKALVGDRRGGRFQAVRWVLEQKPRGVACRVLVECDELGVFEQVEALWVLLLDHLRDGRDDYVRGLKTFIFIFIFTGHSM